MKQYIISEKELLEFLHQKYIAKCNAKRPFGDIAKYAVIVLDYIREYNLKHNTKFETLQEIAKEELIEYEVVQW
nr:MAG TPA: hypothetical protein [Caudoviricetes sp.]